MPDQKQRLEIHADAIRVSQAHPSEVGTEWSTWRPLRLPADNNKPPTAINGVPFEASERVHLTRRLGDDHKWLGGLTGPRRLVWMSETFRRDGATRGGSSRCFL